MIFRYRLLLALILFFVTLPLTSWARDFQIRDISIQAEIQPDATIRYVENRRYRFEGEYSFAFYTLPLRGFDSIDNIRVRQDGKALINENTEQPGTFKVERNEHELRITWFIETQDTTEHTFTIQYDLDGALVTGPEESEWFWVFLSDRLARMPESFQARISLPQRIESDEWHIWLRDTPDHVAARPEGRVLFLEGEDFNRNDAVRARILFPTRVLTDARITDRRFGLDRVMDEEAAWEAAQERERQLYLLGVGLFAMLAPASILLFIWFYRRYGRRYESRSNVEKLRFTPPSDHPPALIRKLMLGPLNTEPDKLGLGITIFDLSRRGYFRIVEKKGEKKFLQSETPEYHLEKTGKKPDESLAEWERMLMDKVNEQLDEDITRMDKVMDWKDKSTRDWWKKWRKRYREALKSLRWFDPVSQKALYFHLLAQFPLFVGMIGVTILAGKIGAAGIILVAVMMLLSLTLPKRTREGTDLHAVWTAYRKALKKGPNRSFDQKDMGRHFVYAIALGLTKKQLEKRLADVSEESPLFLWIVPMSGIHGTAGVASGLSTLASSGTSSFSGVSGVGGASAGSAGGGAGGGAG
ncbi:MAG: DUF2207 domain-containing protein [Cyclonatronaceae bacterium]